MIKTYSPNLMVHPLMRSGNSISGDIEMGAENVSRPIIDMLSRLHVLVVGPGLGRDPLMLATAANVIKAARKRSMPVVIDADALRIVNERPWLLREYKQAVLTPNVVEFGRLEKAIVKNVDQSEGTAGRLVDVAKELKGVTVVQKGAVDCIGSFPWRGPEYGPIVCDLPGGRKRSGGQGDTLTGAIATFLAWGQAYRDNLWTSKNEVGRLDDDELVMLAAFGGCAITRVSTSPSFSGRVSWFDGPNQLGMFPARICQARPQSAGERPDWRGSHGVQEPVRGRRGRVRRRDGGQLADSEEERGGRRGQSGATR